MFGKKKTNLKKENRFLREELCEFELKNSLLEKQIAFLVNSHREEIENVKRGADLQKIKKIVEHDEENEKGLRVAQDRIKELEAILSETKNEKVAGECIRLRDIEGKYDDLKREFSLEKDLFNRELDATKKLLEYYRQLPDLANVYERVEKLKIPDVKELLAVTDEIKKGFDIDEIRKLRAQITDLMGRRY